MRRFFQQLFHSFPIQLLLLHLRSNLLLLSLWVVLLLMMSGSLGRRLGLQYLFLDPEYLGEVNFLSFYIVGMALGGFFMSWNLTTYLLTAQYFPFLASLTRPFSKFSINNLLLPLAFGGFYLLLIGYFQNHYQELSLAQNAWHLLALVLGSLTLVVGYSVYFNFTNRDISYYQRKQFPPNQVNLHIPPGHRRADLDYLKQDRNRLKVWTYLGENLRPRLVRSVAHYESRMLLNIFKQNHLNALALQLISMMLLLLLGYLVDWEIFRIPAGASIIILFSLLIAFIGALTYWFAAWRAFVILLLLFGINYITSFGIFNHPNAAYGLNYEGERAEYSYDRLQQICYEDQLDKDLAATQEILATRIGQMSSGNSKPKIVFLCASGGGLKAATWSTHVLQSADSLSQGRLFDHTVLMTGASGGMLGLAYQRELYRLNKENRNEVYRQEYRDRISLDLLNSIAFTLVANDLFVPWRRFEYGGHHYFRDRGYVLEEQLNENTEGILDRPLAAYRQEEISGEVPLLYLSPAIVNDGRQMIISPQGVSFMMLPPVGFEQPKAYEIDAVDFRWLLGKQGADSLRFLTALRMNATYPYVLPTVHLPTQPTIALVDAGFRDNYGIQSATRFIQVYQDWIKKNTSGVILVQITSSERFESIPASDAHGIVESLFNPLGIAGKVLEVQELQHDNTLSFINDLLGPDHFELIRFIYRPTNDKKLEASVSFHLTQQEKQDVLEALSLPANQESMRRLLESLGTVE
ncbi:patatin-like phospholipase family protein [Lewinella sp. LCG006]|uniref:patatin-like phospholipase family protein n=1 Tax=Lewinella sp. LCG006 TaxID=3231911 RepID=UPI003460663B